MSEVRRTVVKQNKPQKKNKFLSRFFFFAFIIALMLLCSAISFRYVTDKQKVKDKAVVVNIPSEKRIAIDIPYNSNTESIANILKDNHIINNTFLFKLMSKINGFDGTYQSGTHILSKGLDYDTIMYILSSKPESIRVTIPEGYNFKQVADVLSSKKLIDKDKFNNAANSEKYDFEFLRSLPKRDYRLEGYLFPDTYEFDLKAGEKEIIKRMLQNFDLKFKKEYYKTAQELKMTPDQIIILASIIEREAKDYDERKTIAGVFYNRLKSSNKSLKKLQSCATLQYIIYNKTGTIKENLTKEDEEIEDPYNTYMYAGLPPGPICNPGKASIEAALNPEIHDYLYFVSKNDGTGTHIFSRSYREHVNAINAISKK